VTVEEADDSGRIALETTRSRAIADEWFLVLAAEGLDPHITRVAEGFRVDVPANCAERAHSSLASYSQENPPRRPPDDRPPPFDLAAGVGFAALIAMFFAATGPRSPDSPWFAEGNADAWSILHGEIWRTVTALTLHADLGHLVGNALAGVLFIGAVCGQLGAGLGLALVLASGAAGNLANALFHEAGHRSVGASTAVFGAVGLLAALGLLRRHARGTRGRRVVAPLAAGLGLLAMLGTGENADLSAHLFGLGAGVLFGLTCARPLRQAPAPPLQWALGGAAAIVLAGCWNIARG
jgi:membrane associated rhomboid family serine protease